MRANFVQAAGGQDIAMIAVENASSENADYRATLTLACLEYLYKRISGYGQFISF